MLVNILKCKILRAEVTAADADYEGSLAIDSEWMERIGMLPYEKILVGNITNGERFETYAIPAPHGSRAFAVNGAAAHKASVGDRLVIMVFAQMSAEEAAKWTPSVLVLDNGNRVIVNERGPDVVESRPFQIV